MTRWRWYLTRRAQIDDRASVGVYSAYGRRTGAYAPEYLDRLKREGDQQVDDRQGNRRR
jgi:hypothetical protein